MSCQSQLPGNTSISRMASAWLAVAVMMLTLAGPAAARLSPAAAPKRCNPQGFKPDGGKPLLYLYVWAGVADAVGASATSSPQPKDFVATIDATEGSPCFGQVISEADVPTSGNEPHHVGLNQNATVLGVGGFNSWRFNQPSLYFFDVATDPAQPKFIKSVTPNKGAVADDLIRLPSGGFLVSLMGDKKGGSSGRVAEIDADLNLVAEHPRSETNIEAFNPHGLALTPGPINRFVTLDYVEYNSTFKPSGTIRYRTTARIWDQKAREIIKVVDLGSKAKGLMTVRYIPNVGNGALFFISTGRGVLYLLDALSGTATQTYDARVGEGHCVMTLPFRNSSRIIMSIYTSNQIRLLDITDVNALKDLQNYDLPKGTGPHAIVIAPGERLVALSNYYVNHNQGLGVAGPFTDLSDKSVRLFSVAADGNRFVPHPTVPVIDFKNLFPHKGVARPHGMAFKAVPVKA